MFIGKRVAVLLRQEAWRWVVRAVGLYFNLGSINLQIIEASGWQRYAAQAGAPTPTCWVAGAAGWLYSAGSMHHPPRQAPRLLRALLQLLPPPTTGGETLTTHPLPYTTYTHYPPSPAPCSGRCCSRWRWPPQACTPRCSVSQGRAWTRAGGGCP